MDRLDRTLRFFVGAVLIPTGSGFPPLAETAIRPRHSQDAAEAGTTLDHGGTSK